MDNLEIERKYLIDFPNVEKILNIKSCEKWEIEQVYLGGGSRIRKIITNGKELFIHTQKYKVNEITRREIEKAISKNEFDELYKTRDLSLNIINKTRYRIKIGEFTYEIDIYPFWTKIAVLEVELESEAQKFDIPEFVSVIREVTFDKKYTNYSLAKQVPNEHEI